MCSIEFLFLFEYSYTVSFLNISVRIRFGMCAFGSVSKNMDGLVMVWISSFLKTKCEPNLIFRAPLVLIYRSVDHQAVSGDAAQAVPLQMGLSTPDR